ncbi:hypothetical protein GOP47_0005117 [Adiantum capillus-veneris]|uniref:PROP1-like PPR domain-containing protein n=1 Tax=Adiantum capillus-veneris TaxID=13818 RepID=A0A9D4V5M4_ADICA|nr:hypothetical protein GOP47_0005117 [Adiantum capillus-veneris]
MASSKLLLPSSAALFQSAPFSSSALSVDKHRHVFLPSAPLRSLALQTPTFDPASTARFYSDGQEALSVEDVVSSSDGEAANSQEEEEEEGKKEEEGSHGSASTRTPASTSDVKGTLSKYVWTRPHRELPSLSREERAAIVESLLNNRSNLLVALDKARYRLAPSDFGNLLRQLLLSRQWDKVGLVFDWMKVNKKLRAQSLSVYITLMGKAGLHFKALRAYNGLTDLDLKQNKYVGNALLKALIDAGSIEKAFTIFEELKSEGFQPDAYTYSTVIAACAKRPGAYEKAMGYVEEMSSRGLKPDEFIYSSLLHVCARSGLENEANALFEEMQTNGIKPAPYHYAPLLNMYAEKKKSEEAERVFEDFQKAGLPLNEVILNSLMKAYMSCGKIEEATRIFEEMPSLSCPPGAVTYSLMIDAYCKSGLVERAQTLFEDMKKQDSNPGNYVYAILITTYAKMGHADVVISLYKELENRKEGLSDPVLFNSVLKSFCELGLMDAVMNTLKRMNKECVSPDRATFNILICFFCKQGMLDIALHTLNDLKARKFRPNMNSYAPLIIELANTGKVEEALKLLCESREYGVHPSATLWCSVIDALCTANRLDEAFTEYKTMADSGISPLPSCLQNILILAGTNPSGANLDIVDELLGYGSMASKVLNEVKLSTILSAYAKEGFYTSMHKLLDFTKRENLNVGKDEGWDELISNLKQDGQAEILAKLEGHYSEAQLSAASSAL